MGSPPGSPTDKKAHHSMAASFMSRAKTLPRFGRHHHPKSDVSGQRAQAELEGPPSAAEEGDLDTGGDVNAAEQLAREGRVLSNQGAYALAAASAGAPACHLPASREIRERQP